MKLIFNFINIALSQLLRNTFLLFLYVWSLQCVNANPIKINLKFERLSINDGLSQSTVYCILQDHFGFMWFGTENGLNKFDGFNFTVYQNIPGDSTSISSNRILSLFEDHSGNLWIGTIDGGLERYDREKELFIHFAHHDEDNNSLSHNRVMCIFEDHNGIIWVGTAGGGLNRLDPKTGIFRHYRPELANPYALSNNVIRSIIEDKSGSLWIGTDGGGLNEFDPETGTFSSIKYNPVDKNTIPDNSIRSLFLDHFGLLWIGTSSGLCNYNRTTGKYTSFVHNRFDPYSISDNYIYSIFEDHIGRIWIGTNNGLNCFDRETSQFINYKNDPNDLHSLSNNIVRAIYQDKSGLFWIGTYRSGLNKFEFDHLKFIHYRASSGFPNCLTHPVISSIFEDSKGNLWLGTWGGGLNVFDRAWTNMKVYKNNPDNSKSISNDIITCITEDRDGKLWIGTYDGGLNQFDYKTGDFTRYMSEEKNKNWLNNNRVMALYVDAANTLWISTFGGGVNVLDPIRKNFTQHVTDEMLSSSISNNRVWPIAQDHKGNIWLGTDGSGLDKFDPITRKFYNFQHESKNSNSLSNNVIICLFIDKQGIIWIGTDGGGINRFDPELGIFKSYRTPEGLPNDVVNGILQDAQGFLWISTHKGLARFDPGKETFIQYGVNDGLQSNEFNEGACFYSNSGQMFFGGVNGFNAFYPSQVKQNPSVPPIVITDFRIFYQKVKIGNNSPLKKSITLTHDISLKYSQNVITIEFAALNYHNPQQNKYKYFLKGFDNDTIDAGNRRSVTYTNLNPGEYSFYVLGASSDGVWNNRKTSLKITIIPPFWLTTWFIGIIVSIIGIFVILYIRNREQRLKQDKRTLEDIVQQRTLEIKKQKEELEKANVEIRESALLKEMFLANTSHEIRTPLNVINGFTNLLLNTKLEEKQRAYLDNIKNSSNNLSVLINDILDFSKIEAGKLTIEEIDFNIRDLINSLVSSNSIKANEKHLRFIYHIDERIPEVLKGDPLRLHQILLNLIQNAIKFTDEGGSVSVDIDQISDSPDVMDICFSVTDTGIGIPKEKIPSIFDSFTQIQSNTTRLYGGTGLGLSIVKRLIDLQNGQITIESEERKGSVFKVYLTYKKTTIINIKDRELSFRIRKSESLSSTRILLVEDNEINIALARDTILLYNSRIKIDVARNGIEAVEKVKKDHFDIVIMDIQMPEMDGYEATRIIRNELPEPMRKVPILGMSAHAMREEREKCFDLGMNDYITKPFVPEKLFNKIEALTQVKRDEDFDPLVIEEKVKKHVLKSVDLTLLNSTYRNDLQKILKILELYLKNIPVQLHELISHNKEHNLQNIRISAHSLKTSFNYIGLNSARDICKSIENECIQSNEKAVFDNFIGQIETHWHAAESEIMQYIAQHK